MLLQFVIVHCLQVLYCLIRFWISWVIKVAWTVLHLLYVCNLNGVQAYVFEAISFCEISTRACIVFVFVLIRNIVNVANHVGYWAKIWWHWTSFKAFDKCLQLFFPTMFFFRTYAWATAIVFSMNNVFSKCLGIGNMKA